MSKKEKKDRGKNRQYLHNPYPSDGQDREANR